MPFERGWWLLALVLLIPFAYWLIRAERRRRDDLATLAHASILPNLTPDPLRTRLRIVALTAAVGCLLLAVAGWRRSLLDDVPRNDRDILIVVDTSLSMAAQDIEPSRMEYARDVIRGLLQRAQGERVGIVAFSGTAILQCPLTRDYAAVSMYANSLIPGMLPVPGTAVGDALRQAISAFSDDHSRARLVLLMTDGEDHDDPPSQIAQQLRQNGIRFFALGIGTESGAPIPLIDANGALVGYKRDRASRLVSSRLNAALLREIVDAADGEVELVTSNRSVEPFLDSMTRVENVARRRRVQPFQTAMALIAIVCLLADVWAGGGYRRET